MKRNKNKSSAVYGRLESRQLLAGIQFDSATGIVSIDGTAGDDVVRAVMVNETDIRFTFEGVDTQTFAKNNVTQISFLGLAGDDFFRNDTSVPLSANGGLGDDVIYGGSGSDSIAGDAGENRLFGGDGDDSLYGGVDRDELRGGAGNDVLVGGDDDDLLVGDSGDDLLLGNDGDDTLFGNRGHDRLFGHDGQDELSGGDGADQLYGGNDDDTLLGEQGFDELRGDAGDDWLSGGTENDQVYGGDGNDRLFGDAGNDLLIDDLGDDRLYGREGNDFLAGGRGADQIFGEAGDDTLVGGSENDLLNGGAGDDGVFGNDGDDDLYGDAGEDRIAGADGDDLLVGGSEDDRMIAGAGNDIVLAGPGRDFILGGIGNDFIRGDEGDDTVYAGDGNDRIRGSSGDDHLFGQAGDDYINGDLDRDVVYGGPGVDTVDGGAGDDDVRGDADDQVITDDDDGDEDDDHHRHGIGRPVGLSNRLTVSFAPDGTSVFDQTSSLFSSFAGSVSDQEIRDSIFTSFNLWSANGNLDVGLVNDSGDPFGTPGKAYGDARFGDVRIGAIDLPADVNAIAMGQGDFIAGTWAGDILFNSNAQFDSVEEFFAVALHEVGHVLGLGHTPDLGSVMHRYSKRTTLAPQDIVAFQQLYGNRALDHNEPTANSNDSIEDATRIELFGDEEDGELPTLLFGDISNSNDIDYFEYRVPIGYSGSTTFTLTSEAISQLDGKVTLYDAAETIVDQAVMDSDFGGTITVTAPASGSSRYYLRVETDSTNAQGRFALLTSLDGRNTISNEVALQTARNSAFSDWEPEDLADYFETGENYLFNDDLSSNDQIETATELETEDGFELATRFEYAASLASATDVDYYQFESIEFSGQAPTMNISVRSTEYGGMIPKVTVLDGQGNVIPSQVAVNGRGETTIQVTDYQSDSDYYLRVESDDLIAFNNGNYQLAISHSDESLQFQNLAAGVLDAGTPKFHSIHVAESQIFQFALEASSSSAQRPIIWATIFDQSGNIVFQGATRNGERRTTDATLLAAGSYVVRIDSAPGATFTNLNYQFLGIDVSDSQGPKFSDPSASPFDQNTNGSYVYPDNVVKESSYVVVDGVSSNQTTPPKPDPPTNLYLWYWAL